MLFFIEKIDAAPLADDDFSFSFNSWVSVMVDTLNEGLLNIQNQLNGQGIASFITLKTSAQITALINMNALPVLPIGSLWFDTTLNKLKVLVTAAVPGISNGVTETVTSV